ncbi:TonB-dependent receptor [Burkholderia anthina]|uniref:TonB-dependent siderophore receptor n=1 Tax=Burkholderia anthina TaxID=179879 RepID=UPI001CF3FC5A|nr:TonB-dependent receptor [Burkholderia anthina]MCA8095242.1 TonB-dependent receptor [Burkholderia anthina]
MKSRWTTRNRRGLIAGVLGMASVSLYAQALLSIPAQPLASALSALAAKSGVNILAAANLVANRRAPALSGTLNVPDALDRLLQGSGLTAQKTGDKTYVIRPVPPASAPSASSPSEAVLPTITVTGADTQPARGFAAESTRSATRTDTPLDELPQSVQVVTGDVLKSQQSQSVADALHNVSGVEIKNGSTQGIAAGGVAVIDGFQAQVTINGNLGPDSGTALNLPMAAISSVEVLKGADAVVSGYGSPGGTVNVVQKTPQATPVHEISLQTGSYGDWLGSLDLAGAIANDSRLTYRFIVSGETAGESYGGMIGKRDFYIAPSLRWKSGDTDVIVGFEQHTYRTPFTPYATFLPTGLTPIYQSLGNQQAYTWTNSTSVHYDWTQKLNSSLTFHSTARYDASSSNTPFFASIDTSVSPISPDATQYAGQASVSHSYTTTFDNNLQIKFSTGPIQHTLLGGVNYQISRGGSSQFSNSVIGAFPLTSPVSINSDPLGAWNQRSNSSYYNSLYLQDQIAWQRLHVLVSMTRPRYWTNTDPSYAAWVPNVGVLYQLTGSLGIFANAQRSFSTQGGYLEGGAAPPPLLGRSIEAGLKFELLDDKLSGTLSVHRSTYNNEVVPLPGSIYEIAIPTGETARGMSIDLAGRLLSGWNIIAHYSYNDFVLPSQYGSYAYNATSRHSGSLWTTYDFQRTPLRGWGVGGGIWLRGSTPAGFSSEGSLPLHIPGQARVDATVYYVGKDWSARLAVKNVFNRYLYGDGGFAELAPGRLIYLTTTYDF